MLDKILLILLVILLPAGIMVSKQVFKKPINEAEIREAQVQEVSQLISKLEEQAEETVTDSGTENEIMVSGIGYASESGILKIEGQAGSGTLTVMAAITALPEKVQIPELEPDTGNRPMGQEVVWRSVKPEPDGRFIFEYQLEGETEVVEVRLRQAEKEQVIQFDTKNMRQVY